MNKKLIKELFKSVLDAISVYSSYELIKNETFPNMFNIYSDDDVFTSHMLNSISKSLGSHYDGFVFFYDIDKSKTCLTIYLR